MSSPQPQNDPVIRKFLERIAGLRERISKIVLFGSRARRDSHPWSDYDVLLLVDNRISFWWTGFTTQWGS
jgi:predicted nucleotidyltransferase